MKKNSFNEWKEQNPFKLSNQQLLSIRGGNEDTQDPGDLHKPDPD